MYALVEFVNGWGKALTAAAGAMLIQSGILILIVFALDLAFRRRVRAVFRYWVWVLVLVKLVLPPTLSAPFSAGYWLAAGVDRLHAGLQRPSTQSVDEPAATAFSEALEPAQSEVVPLPQPAISDVPQFTGPELEVAPASRDRDQTAAIRPRVARTDTSRELTRLNADGVLFLLWAAACAAMTVLVVLRTRAIERLVRRSTKGDEALCNLLQSCRRRVPTRADVSIRVSPALSTPAVYGIRNPIILIPSQVRRRMTPDELEIVVIHELVHVRRGDLSIKLLQTILQVVYFYNPLLWLANAMIRRVREQAVDETVLVTLGTRAITQYPRALVQVAGLTFGRPGFGLRLIGVAESKGLLTERIKIMLHKPIPTSAKLGVFGAIVLTSLALFLLPMARAQDKPADVPSSNAASAAVAVEASPVQAGTSVSADAAEENLAPAAPAQKLVTRVTRVLQSDGKNATVVTTEDLEGKTFHVAVSGEGDDLKALEAQIAQLRKELDERMEMLRLLEGKLKVAQLEMRMKERISGDKELAVAAEKEAAKVHAESLKAEAAREKAYLEQRQSVSVSSNVPHAAATTRSYAPAQGAVQPGAAEYSGRTTRRVPAVVAHTRTATEVSPEVRQAVQDLLPQILDEVLPKVIEEVMAKMEQKSTGR